MKNYCIQARNATAVNILRSWLNAVKIYNRPSGQEGSDLTVTAIDGSEIYVKVCAEGDAPPPEGVHSVLAHEMTGKKGEVALAAFHRITGVAGYGRPRPLDRGVEPELNEQGNPRKLHYRDEPMLVAIRHTEFRRSPNPPDDRWKQYRPIIEKTAWGFMRLNYELCLRAGYGIDDLMSYARCWTVNFCARYETPTPAYHDNERKLYAHLQQRFAFDLRPVLKKKERSVLPDAETVSVALYGHPDYWDQDSRVGDEEDRAYVKRNCKLDLTTAETRRESAAKLLGELLGELPHDKLVAVLSETAENAAFDPIARKEAMRRLRLHAEDCVECGAEPKLPGSELPQADVFVTLRCLLLHLFEGVHDRRKLSNAIRISSRQVAYYANALRLLGLAEGDFGKGMAVTERGEEMLGTDPGTQEEADAFGDAIRSTQALRPLGWLFESPEGVSREDLTAFILARYDLSPSTAERRATSLLAWRNALRNPGVEEDEELPGADARGA